MAKPKSIGLNKNRGDIPEMLVYGYLGSGENQISAMDFVSQFKDLEKTNKTIYVRINSGGGSIFDGLAMYNAVKSSSSEVICYVDGLAASMASVLALAGSKTYMNANARMMTHKARMTASGQADAMRQNADLLDSLVDSMAVIYANKTGMEKALAKETFMGDGDKWMTSQEALEAKLIDGIFDGAKIQVPVNATEQDLFAIYSNHFLPKYNTMEEIVLSATQLAQLNLTAHPTAEAVGAAIDSLIAAAAQVPVLEAKLNEVTAAHLKMDVQAAIEKAKAEKRISIETGLKLQAKFANDLQGLVEVLATMPVYTPITTQIEAENEKGELAKLSAKTFDELDKSGELPKLKELSMDTFKAKFKEQFHKEYSGK